MSPPNIIELDSVRRDHENSNSDDKRNQTKQARLAADRKKRYMKVAQIGVPVGVTNMDAKDGPGQLVFYVADRHANVYARRAKGHTCSEKHVIFKASFDRDEERRRAVKKRAEAIALQTLELRGQMTTAEAVMADRHKGAFEYALRLAANKNNFTGAVPWPQDHIDNPVALSLLKRYNDTYGQDISKELMAHACTFYLVEECDFPKRFDVATHLDYFIIWYKSQVYVQRHNSKPQLDNTIRQLSPKTIHSLIEKALNNVDEIAQYSHRVLTPENFDYLYLLSPIANADVKPDFPTRDYVRQIADQMRGLGYNVEKELQQIFML